MEVVREGGHGGDAHSMLPQGGSSAVTMTEEELNEWRMEKAAPQQIPQQQEQQKTLMAAPGATLVAAAPPTPFEYLSDWYCLSDYTHPFSPHVPELTCMGILQRIYQALCCKHDLSSDADVLSCVQQPVTMSLLTTRVGSKVRPGTGRWAESIRPWLASLLPPVSGDNLEPTIQYLHFCVYAMSLMPSPLVEYHSSFGQGSYNRLPTEVCCEPLALHDLLVQWRPMPPRKGKQYMVTLTEEGRMRATTSFLVVTRPGGTSVRPRRPSDPVKRLLVDERPGAGSKRKFSRTQTPHDEQDAIPLLQLLRGLDEQVTELQLSGHDLRQVLAEHAPNVLRCLQEESPQL
mmetsp:Transcript_14762/g.57904  ORF Transcript_14762/g.57904 Transcript_14762/m.57904 type:complete len:345 (+) Transcript_14762:84-1118(+)